MKPFSKISCFVLLFLISSSGWAQQWQVIANEQTIASATSSYTNIAMVSDGAVSIPYVVYTESGIAKVKKQQEGSWTQVGGNVSSGSATYTRIYADETGNVYVTYVDAANGNKLAVKRFNETSDTWEPLNNNNNNLYVSSGSVTNSISQYSSTPRSGLAFDANNVPYIVFGDGSGLNPYVKRFNGSAWETLGIGAISAQRAIGVGIALDENNVPYVAFANQASATATTGNLVLYRFTNNAWESIIVPAQVNGAASGATTGIRHTCIATNNSGNMAIAYFNTGNSNKATVVVYNKTAGTWSYSGAISGRDAPNISLINDISGNMYASFADVITNGSGRSVARVMKLAVGTTTWTELKDASVTTGIDEPAGNISIAVNESSRPYIIYTKANSLSVTTPIVRYFVPEIVTPPAPPAPDPIVNTPKQMEFLTRGVVAARTSASKVYVGWRLLGTDPSGIAFNLYRDGVKLNQTPITSSTNYVDETGTNGNYTVRPLINGVEGAASAPVSVWSNNQLSIPLDIPAGGTTPDGVAYTYSANDCSVGDVDGDGEYEIILKWDPSNSKDNSQAGYTGNVYLDAYKLNGNHLWRIDLGRNIRAGAHYTQFMVYDLDGDGKAEVACKTADGTVDGNGITIGDPLADYRNSSGYVLSGPEYLTIFNGLTGAAMATTNYLPARGTVSGWGDNYGNRVDRFIAAIAYLDGARPSLVMGRGYYTRLVRVAWDWRNGQLTRRWTFDSNDAGNGAYAGQGNHQMSVGDVDGDGKDEIFNGSSAINDNGKGLWSNGLGHGDAMHMTDMDPDRPGQEMWSCHEDQGSYKTNGLVLKDAKTGVPFWGVPTTGDIGRAMAADIDPSHKGYEMWGSSGNLYDAKGVQISTNKPTYNFGIWWDGDLSRELLDGTKLDKWNPATNSLNRLFTIYNAAPVSSNNSTKSNPGLTADLLGDWREEMIFRRSDNTALVLFTTTIPTEHRIYTLMHDPQYRTAIAWQNSAYNQPPYPSFYLGNDMDTPPTPNIVVTDIVPPTVTSVTRLAPTTENTNVTSVTYRVNFSEHVKGVDASGFTLTATGTAAGTVSAVSAASGESVDVTVSEITGDGTLRLDVNSSITAIKDDANNPLTGGFTAGETYNFDHTIPTLPTVAFVSNNANPSYAKEGDIVTLNFTTSESIQTPAVTIAGHTVTSTAGEENSYTASYTMMSTDAEGPVAFTIDFKDLIGNTGTQVTGTTGSKAEENQTVTSSVVYDRTSPLFTNTAVNKPLLLVPNHKMEDVKLNYDLTDRTDVNIVITVTSNETENGLGDGDTAPDWEIVDNHNVKLRAERSGTGNGRTYTITIKATDIAGNESTQTLTVTAPPNQKAQNNKTTIAANIESINQKGLNVSAYPNPSAQYFNLYIQSSSNAPITVLTTDVSGRVIETRTGVLSNSNIAFGHSYQPGVYFVQVIQGIEKLSLKLVKKSD